MCFVFSRPPVYSALFPLCSQGHRQREDPGNDKRNGCNSAKIPALSAISYSLHTLQGFMKCDFSQLRSLFFKAYVDFDTSLTGSGSH